jgi:cell division protein FtsA
MIYVGYIGTTKVAFLKATKKPEGVTEVNALSARLAQGFENGIVKDLAQATETLSQTVRDVLGPEEKSVIPCRLVVSSVYLKSYTFQSSVYFHGYPHAVTLRDVRAAIAQTRSVATIPLNEVIVQAVPQEFLVNDLAGVQNPLGLEANRLGVTLRLLALDFLVYNNLMKVFERCDLEVTEVIPSVLSSAYAVLTSEEKQTGAVLVVIGGAATHFACYKNSVLVETRSIPTGSDCITKVISKNLNVDYLDAQRLKESFGSAVQKYEFQDELIPIPDSNGKKKYTIKRTEFETQMASGIGDFFQEIKHQIHELQESYAPLNQIVFTGGGVRLDGFLEVMKETVFPTARIGFSHAVKGPEALMTDPSFSGLIGGLGYSSKVQAPSSISGERQNWMSRTVQVARDWIFEYL